MKINPNMMIKADQQAFYSALSNLIQNAIKFTPEGGKIQIRASMDGEKIFVEVEDECGGLPENTANNLFNAFEQKSTDRSGLGLGLTIAQCAISLNHGTIQARNLVGKGCIFKITLLISQSSKNTAYF